MVVRVVRSILVLFAFQKLSKVVAFPAAGEKVADAEGDFAQPPKDLFRIQEEAKVLLERDPKLKPQFVAIIHNKFPHPTFPGERSPWFQVYVYSDYFHGMPDEERKKYCQFVISEKLYEAGFHRVSFNCLTMEEENETYRPPEDQLGGPTPIPSAESEYEGPMMKKYKAVLQKNFKLHHIEVIDTSENYHQPANSEKFLTILMVSDEFHNKTEYQREQMVVNALKKDMPWDVRGLALILTSQYEYDHVPDKLTENKLKRFAAMVHTKDLIIQGGYRNITTTMSSREHFSKLVELGDRIYGPLGDENLEDNSKINSKERQLAWDYNEYVERRITKNSEFYLKRLEQMKVQREKDVEERAKNDTILRDVKKLWTLTSFERKLQEFDDVDERFKINNAGDLATATTEQYFYDDKYIGEITTLIA